MIPPLQPASPPSTQPAFRCPSLGWSFKTLRVKTFRKTCGGGEVGRGTPALPTPRDGIEKWWIGWNLWLRPLGLVVGRCPARFRVGGTGQWRELAWAGHRGIPAPESQLEAHVFRQPWKPAKLLLCSLSLACEKRSIYCQEPWEMSPFVSGGLHSASWSLLGTVMGL